MSRTREMRQDLLLTELRRSDVPLSANTLSSLLRISPRTIRDYVAKLNEGMDRPLVISDQLGYRLDQYVTTRSGLPRSLECPRSIRICRQTIRILRTP